MGALLAREGFSALGVNAIAREAGVDKVLIYRYFGGIEGLLDAWGRATLRDASPPARSRRAAAPAVGGTDAAVAALLAFARSARESPQALEILRWELLEDNALTRRVARLRESAGLAQLARFGLDAGPGKILDVPAITAVLSAGLLHIALRARTAPRWLGVPIRTATGWKRLEGAVLSLIRAALADGKRRGGG